MTTSAPRPTGRLITLVRMFRGPMARRGDGLELLTLTAVMLVALLLLLVMLVVGSIIYADVSARGIQESHSRHEVVAVLTEDAPSPSAGGRGNVGTGKSDVPAQWRLPNGTTRTGSVEASDGLKAGAKVDIWVDRQGGLVDPPATPTSAMLTAVVVGAGGWLAGVGLLALAQFGIHCLLDRRRYAAWEREWALVEPGWNNHDNIHVLDRAPDLGVRTEALREQRRDQRQRHHEWIARTGRTCPRSAAGGGCRPRRGMVPPVRCPSSVRGVRRRVRRPECGVGGRVC